MTNGYIYAAREPGRSEVKIGRTRNDPSIRLGQINNSSRVNDLEYEFVLAVSDEVRSEKAAHELLAARRVRKDREFFRCGPRRVRAVMKRAAASVGRYHAVIPDTGKCASILYRLFHMFIGESLATLGLVSTTLLLFVFYVDPVARDSYATIMLLLTAFSALILVCGFNLMRGR